METRPDTSSSSGRFRGQWSFLAHPPQHAQHPRSHPPSSYILQSDRSSVSPLPTGVQYHTINGSRSSLPHNLTTASVGGRSAVSTAPSQPVLIRVHSADASAHTNPAPRPRRPIKMFKNNGLPAVSEFSIQGILAAIQEDVEQDVNTISEILGRSRLVLADQHDSHMPPLGEIRAPPGSLQAVEEASSIDEQLAVDDVFILRDDASLVAASHTGSAAYGLLERLQAVPRTDRLGGGWDVGQLTATLPQPPTRHQSSPAALASETMETQSLASMEPQRTSRNLLRSDHGGGGTANRSTLATVSETHLLAEADGSTSLLHTDSEFGTTTASPTSYEMFSQDPGMDGTASETAPDLGASHSQIPQVAAATTTTTTFRERVQNLLYVSDPTGLSMWLHGQTSGRQSHASSAEGHLRELLDR